MSQITYGVTILNSDYQHILAPFINVMNNLYKKHLEHVSTEKRKREEEEKRQREAEEKKRGTKFMLGKKDAKTVKEANKSKKEPVKPTGSMVTTKAAVDKKNPFMRQDTMVEGAT